MERQIQTNYTKRNARNMFDKYETNIKRHGRQSKKFNKFLNRNTRKKCQRKWAKYEKIMGWNFPDLFKAIKLQNQKSQQISSRINFTKHKRMAENQKKRGPIKSNPQMKIKIQLIKSGGVQQKQCLEELHGI